MDAILKEQLAKLEKEYATQCAQLGNVIANKKKLEFQENAIVDLLMKMDIEAGKIKQQLKQVEAKS